MKMMLYTNYETGEQACFEDPQILVALILEEITQPYVFLTEGQRGWSGKLIFARMGTHPRDYKRVAKIVMVDDDPEDQFDWGEEFES